MEALARRRPVLRWPDLFGGPARLLAAEQGARPAGARRASPLRPRRRPLCRRPTAATWADNAHPFRRAGPRARRGRGRRRAGFAPDIVHAHDWQAGLTARLSGYGRGQRAAARHDHAQPRLPGPVRREPLRSRWACRRHAFALEGVEYYGDVGFLKAGLWFADRITTVSPTYADEICTPEGGMGLDGLLRGRADRLSGILNGIDDAVGTRPTDHALAVALRRRRCSPRAAQQGGAAAHASAWRRRPTRRCSAVVSRLSWQKGLDLLLDALPTLLGARRPARAAGHRRAGVWRRLPRAPPRANPGPHRRASSAMTRSLAHRIQAGADALVVPSPLRTLRPDPALRAALWLRAAGGAGRRA